MAATPTTPAQAQRDYPTAQSFAAFLNQHWAGKRINAKTLGGVQLTGANVGEQWMNWWATESPNHPTASLGDFEVVFFDFAVAESVGGAMVKAEVATGQVTAQAAQATVSGLDQTGKAISSLNPLNALSGIGSALGQIGDFFSRLTQANTWIRIGKVLVGGVLLIIGLAHMTGASDAVSTAARRVPLPV